MEENTLGRYKLTIGETFERLFNQRFRRLEQMPPETNQMSLHRGFSGG